MLNNFLDEIAFDLLTGLVFALLWSGVWVSGTINRKGQNMTTIDFIKMSLEMSKEWVFALIADMKDAPTTFPTPNGGNHPLWILGHVTYSEAELLSEFALVEPNPLAE